MPLNNTARAEAPKPLDLSHRALNSIYEIRHGDIAKAGWGVKLQRKFGYFNPDVHYETVVEQLVQPATSWLDVGGGCDLFPSNRKLAGILSKRCSRLVGVDPSDNIRDNPFVHDRAQAMLEDFATDEAFDLATMRMVVEHVANPESFAGKLGKLVRQGGSVVIYTVNERSPITWISRLTPLWFHVAVKKILWQAREEDSFPTVYRMNTRATLSQLMRNAGFEEAGFLYLDDCRVFSRWKLTFRLELTLWRILRSLGLRYFDQCLLGVYRKTAR